MNGFHEINSVSKGTPIFNSQDVEYLFSWHANILVNVQLHMGRKTSCVASESLVIFHRMTKRNINKIHVLKRCRIVLFSTPQIAENLVLKHSPLLGRIVLKGNPEKASCRKTHKIEIWLYLQWCWKQKH